MIDSDKIFLREQKFQFFPHLLTVCRSSSSRGFHKASVFKNSTNFTGKHLCRSHVRLWHSCFPVDFVKFLRTPFSPSTSEPENFIKLIGKHLDIKLRNFSRSSISLISKVVVNIKYKKHLRKSCFMSCQIAELN